MSVARSPRVSVLMPVHNGERYLSETMATLFAQTLRDFELVIVDDGSTDGTPELLRSYAEGDDRLVVVRNDLNQGLPASLNRGLALCRAPLVARADADDLYAPEHLEMQVAYLHEHPEIGVVSTAVEKMDSEGRFLYSVNFPPHHRQIRFHLLFGCCISHPAVVFRTSVVRDVGGYDERCWTSEDYDLWIRLRDRTRFANTPAPVLRYRRHAGAHGKTRGSSGKRLSASITQRLLSQYTGEVFSLEDTDAVKALYAGKGELDPPRVPRGIELLERILEEARRREDPRTATEFQNLMSGRFMDRSYALADRDRASSRLLWRAAIRWDPARRLRAESWKRGLRLYLPDKLVRAARGARGAVAHRGAGN